MRSSGVKDASSVEGFVSRKVGNTVAISCSTITAVEGEAIKIHPWGRFHAVVPPMLWLTSPATSLPGFAVAVGVSSLQFLLLEKGKGCKSLFVPEPVFLRLPKRIGKSLVEPGTMYEPSPFFFPPLFILFPSAVVSPFFLFARSFLMESNSQAAPM